MAKKTVEKKVEVNEAMLLREILNAQQMIIKYQGAILMAQSLLKHLKSNGSKPDGQQGE